MIVRATAHGETWKAAHVSPDGVLTLLCSEPTVPATPCCTHEETGCSLGSLIKAMHADGTLVEHIDLDSKRAAVEPCEHEVLPLSAPLAVRCDACGQLAPYVPEPFGEPIVLTENGAYALSSYEREFGKLSLSEPIDVDEPAKVRRPVPEMAPMLSSRGWPACDWQCFTDPEDGSRSVEQDCLIHGT